MYITKQKQTHRYRKQTNGYQQGREDRGLVLKGTTYQYKVDKHQGDIVQHQEIQPIF